MINPESTTTTADAGPALVLTSPLPVNSYCSRGRSNYGTCVQCLRRTMEAQGIDWKAYYRETVRTRVRAWRQRETSETYHKKWHRYNRARTYGLNPDEYDAIVANPCAICGTTWERREIDHDHTTGQIRGSLCHKCNKGVHYIEHFGFDWAAKADQYLKDHDSPLRRRQLLYAPSLSASDEEYLLYDGEEG